MKRYVLFAGSDYYPSGGWKDFRAMFDSVEEARQEVQHTDEDWWHIVDLTTGEEIE